MFTLNELHDMKAQLDAEQRQLIGEQENLNRRLEVLQAQTNHIRGQAHMVNEFIKRLSESEGDDVTS